MSGKKAVKKRTRSGCLTCRDRHMKCDEQLPVCQNCVKSQRKCYRGIRLNFIQYSFYDPTDDMPKSKINSLIGSSRFKILDQSITIAGLYNGKKHYRLFMHLHTKADLEESDEVFKIDCEISGNNPFDDNSNVSSVVNLKKYASEDTTITNITTGKPLIAPAPVHHAESSEQQIERYRSQISDASNRMEDISNLAAATSEKVQLTKNRTDDHITVQGPGAAIDSPFFNEDLLTNFQVPNLSFNIQNFLLKPKYEFEPLNLSSSKVNFDNPNFEFDVGKFIKLMNSERYYWVLDLFNELALWKSTIPTYCLNLLNNHDQGIFNHTFLINCLLSNGSDALANTENWRLLLELQLNHFNVIKDMEPSEENFRDFEILFVSLVINFLNLLKSLTNNYEFKKVTFNNQVRIFNKLTYKIFKSFDYVGKSTIFTSCIHSIVALKFLIIKHLEGKGISVTGNDRALDEGIDTPSWQEDLNEVLDYTHEEEDIISRLNYFEILNLGNNFENLNLAQSSGCRSNAYKVRTLMWSIIKLDYAKRNPEFVGVIDVNISNDISPFEVNTIQQHLTFPNEKLTFLVLLVEYAKQLLQNNDEMNSNLHKDRINSIFNIIQNSMIDEDLKRLWVSTFEWMSL